MNVLAICDIYSDTSRLHGLKDHKLLMRFFCFKIKQVNFLKRELLLLDFWFLLIRWVASSDKEVM